jgi:predicted lipoprotein with Yx(FWY)xxD motif
MKRLLAPVVLAAGALTLAACGSDDDGSSPSTSASSAGAASTATTVEVVNIDGVGETLADAEGRVLYTADEEAANPDVVCTDACEQFWHPLTVGSEQPTGGPGVADLGVTERPDGTMQVTYEGHRLYTFTQDSAGKASGDGFADTFGGQRFTWHAVVVDAASAGSGTATPTPTTSGSDSGYPGY